VGSNADRPCQLSAVLHLMCVRREVAYECELRQVALAAHVDYYGSMIRWEELDTSRSSVAGESLQCLHDAPLSALSPGKRDRYR
jgi:hypothetical protein